jgi:Carbamoyl-phosphate synthase L chain, ATP binding domain
MKAEAPRVGVVYEHPAWFAPLFAELDRRGLPYDRIDVSRHTFNPDRPTVPWSLVLNRMSPSAYLRDHGQAITYTREFLRYLEGAGADVINGSEAFALETSKVAQYQLLRRLHLRVPRARVVNHPSQAPGAAADLTYPVIVKPNIGGSGAGMQRFETPEALRAGVESGTLSVGIDHTALVQEFLAPRDGHIVRVEVMDGRFLYAIKVFPKFEEGFNLCPADICRPGETVETPSQSAPANGGPVSSTSLCPADLPKVALKVEGYVPPDAIIRDVAEIARAARIDLGGVEYLTSDEDGQVYYYDINALSNFVSDAVHVVGFDPYAALVDYLVVRGRLREPAMVSGAMPIAGIARSA